MISLAATEAFSGVFAGVAPVSSTALGCPAATEVVPNFTHVSDTTGASATARLSNSKCQPFPPFDCRMTIRRKLRVVSSSTTLM